MTMVRAFASDLVSAAHALWRRPLLLLLSVLPLAVAIAGLSALFAVVNGALLRPAAGILDPQQRLFEIGRDERLDSLPYPVFEDIARDASSFDAVYAWRLLPVNARAGSSSGSIRGLGMLVSGRYFEALGIRAVHGRLLGTVDDVAGTSQPRVVLSHSAFERLLGGDPQRLRDPVTINGHAFTVVGVAAASFRGHIALLNPDYYLPMTVQPLVNQSDGAELLTSRGSSWLAVGGRLVSGTDAETAAAQLRALEPRIAALTPAGVAEPTLRMRPLRAIPSSLIGPLAGLSGLLSALVAVVLLVACSNTAGWLLARGEARLFELGLRVALGASRGRILSLLLAEAVLIAVLAGAFAVVGVKALLGLLPAIEVPAPFPVEISLPLDGAVLWFTLLTTLLTVLAAGLAPAVRMAGAARRAAIGTRATRRSRTREWLVGGQVALTTLLLVIAGLLALALHKSQAVDIGFDPARLATADLDLEPSGLAQPRQQAIMAEVLERVRATPGVQAAALARVVPLTLNQMSLGVVVDDGPPEHALSPSANVVSPGFFAALGIGLSGRDFSDRDTASTEGVVVINRMLAERLFGAADAIGRSFRYGSRDEARTLRVIGVVPNGRYASYHESPEPFMYLTLAQYPSSRLNLLQRSSLPLSSLAASTASVITAVDSNLPPPQLHAMVDTIALSLLPQRIAASIAAALGALGLLLAGFGLYALMAQFVTSHTREIGVRLSLGASPALVARQVAWRGARLIVAGLVLGLIAAAVLAQLGESLLFGVDAGSVLAFIVTSILVVCGGAAACLGPAHRASRTEPVVALRHD